MCVGNIMIVELYNYGLIEEFCLFYMYYWVVDDVVILVWVLCLVMDVINL